MDNWDDRRRLVPVGVLVIVCLLLFFSAPSDAGGSQNLDEPPDATPAPAPTAGTTAPGDPDLPDWASMSLDEELDSAQPQPAPPSHATPEAPPVAPQTQGEEETVQPPTTSEPAETPPPGATTYVVKRGDTLYEIAISFGIPLDTLLAANPLPNPHRLEVGQIIIIPDGSAAAPQAIEPAPAVTDVEVPDELTDGATYTVQRGDTLFKIAQRYGLDMQTLVDVNQLSDPNRIEVGQVLRMSGDVPPPAQPTPSPAGPPPQPPPESPDTLQPGAEQTYAVQRGDTLNKIARRFGTTVSALATANSLSNPNRIMPGQQLIIARGTPDAPPDPAPTPTPAPATESSGTADKLGQDQPFILIWPVTKEEGWLVKRFQYGHRAIDTILPIGTPIIASAAGFVEFSGWNSGGYGNLVVIDHDNGYRTLYAHQSERQVATGDQVAQGQRIGLVGSTGWSTHPHLHFEVIINNERVDPCLHLPTGCD